MPWAEGILRVVQSGASLIATGRGWELQPDRRADSIAQKVGDAFARDCDNKLQDYLSQSGVEWDQLDETACLAAEDFWRGIYGRAFLGRSRLKHGAKADFEYQRESCNHYLVVPFSAGVAGLPVHVRGRRMSGHVCRGPLVTMAAFCDVEFFVCPTDFAWAMVHTHEDHAFGGPYFIRAEWLAGCDGK